MGSSRLGSALSRHLPLALAAALAAGCDSRDTTPTAPAQSPSAVPQPQVATYEVTFEGSWSAASHPGAYPARAHFSPTIGATHDAGARFWDRGELASEGIERMAERGSVSPLDAEIERAIRAGTAEHVLRGDGLASSPGRETIRFAISRSRPRVTLVSMVAPSPDWFVGVSGLDLFAGGSWAELVVVPLYPWDAGTDGGATFDSADVEEQPHRAIAPIDEAPLAAGGAAVAMGSFTFRRVG
jgi:hypothetical protein